MHYRELLDIVREKYDVRPGVEGNSPALTDIRLLGGNGHRWNEHVLYVGSLARVEHLPRRPIMLLTVDEPPPLPEGSSYALIRREDLFDLFNLAKDLIFDDLRGYGAFFALAQTALNENTIDCVINTAATLLGNALVLVDLGQKVLAHSTNYEITDPLWAQNVERGYCAYEFVQKVRSNKDMQEWSKRGSETKLITLPGDRQPKLVARVTRDGHVVGAVVMIEHHTPIGRMHQRLLPLVGKLLFDVVYRDSAPGGWHGSYYSAVLYNLLDEAEVTNDLAYIATSNADFPAEMLAVVARFVRRIENRYLKRTFSLELERIFPRGHSVIYKSYVGILVPSVSREQRKELALLAQKEDVSIGLSWAFKDITQFKKYFYQAVASIKLAQRMGQTNQVFDYSDFFFYDLLNNYNGKIALERYCHPALQLLRQYDQANNTELYITLRTYLENEKNLRATADALFIHRNTLIYRINRINQVIKLDLSNTKVVHALIDSFRIESFLA